MENKNKECAKCSYKSNKLKIFFNKPLCNICSTFAPNNEKNFQIYVSEKIDWKELDTFRKFNQTRGEKQKSGMSDKASKGFVVNRAPFGYDSMNGRLVPNKDSAKVHSLFRTFLNRKYSLNSLAKNFSLSVNGLKKILSNRVYLGEIKFSSVLARESHKALVSPEIFYAVQRKLRENYLRPRKKH